MQEDKQSQANVMDKIALMESALLAMSKKINKLETEKKTEEDQIQLLEVKLDHVEHQQKVPDVLEVQVDDNDDDQMNLQIGARI